MVEYCPTIPQIQLKKHDSTFKQIKLTSSLDSHEYIREFYSDDIDIYESFFILLLNNANMTIAYAKISQGGTTGTVIDVKLIAKYCIESLATQVILAHNHPSGTLRPSQADILTTKKIKKTLELIDSKIIDHLIITKNDYYSFADENILK